MSCYKCPYCNENMAIIDKGTSNCFYLNFDKSSDSVRYSYNPKYESEPKPNSIEVIFYKCPSCEKISIKCNGISKNLADLHVDILPQTTAIQYPDYVPLQIRQDYEEAYAILNLSPKASATLSRRCLQGMIRDFYAHVRFRGKAEENFARAINSAGGIA